jgi:hypothetical protein
MRNGRLLTEDNPQALLTFHQADSLNDIVLKLCKNDKFDESFVGQNRILDGKSYYTFHSKLFQ